MKYLIGFIVGVLITAVLLLNFMELCHLTFERNMGVGGYEFLYTCFYPYDFVTRFIGYKWGNKVKEIYKFIVKPTKRRFEEQNETFTK